MIYLLPMNTLRKLKLYLNRQERIKYMFSLNEILVQILTARRWCKNCIQLLNLVTLFTNLIFHQLINSLYLRIYYTVLCQQ